MRISYKRIKLAKLLKNELDMGNIVTYETVPVPSRGGGILLMAKINLNPDFESLCKRRNKAITSIKSMNRRA